MNIGRSLTYVFALPGPDNVPALTTPLPEEDRSLANRYMSLVNDLRDSSIFRAEQRFAFKVSAGSEAAQVIRFLNREISRGLAVTFRQLYSTEEDASFTRICNVLCKHLKTEPAEIKEKGISVISAWREAHSKLCGNTLSQLVRRKMIDEGLIGGAYKPFAHELPPEQLISLYLYGDWIHWDKRRREDLEQVAKYPILEGMYRMNSMEAIPAFSHIYISGSPELSMP